MQEHHINPLTGEDEGLAVNGDDATQRITRMQEVPVNPNDPNTWGKVQRNAPCPCGSGRKFKHCHGALV
jgi:preprotein translocase subunit SecA